MFGFGVVRKGKAGFNSPASSAPDKFSSHRSVTSLIQIKRPPNGSLVRPSTYRKNHFLASAQTSRLAPGSPLKKILQKAGSLLWVSAEFNASGVYTPSYRNPMEDRRNEA
jgi:hypothetical protein